MLKINNKDHYDKMWDMAKETNSFESFERNLRYLHEYGGLKDPECFRVSLGYDFSFTGLSVLWERKEDDEYKFMMNGGLVYHKDSNDWSVHT